MTLRTKCRLIAKLASMLGCRVSLIRRRYHDRPLDYEDSYQIFF